MSPIINPVVWHIVAMLKALGIPGKRIPYKPFYLIKLNYSTENYYQLKNSYLPLIWTVAMDSVIENKIAIKNIT